jgi:hypothetical protein
MSVASQADLFASEGDLPPGMPSMPEGLSGKEERAAARCVADASVQGIEYHGFLGKRRTMSFGWRCDFNGRGFQEIDPIP